MHFFPQCEPQLPKVNPEDAGAVLPFQRVRCPQQGQDAWQQREAGQQVDREEHDFEIKQEEHLEKEGVRHQEQGVQDDHVIKQIEQSHQFCQSVIHDSSSFHCACRDAANEILLQ